MTTPTPPADEAARHLERLRKIDKTGELAALETGVGSPTCITLFEADRAALSWLLRSWEDRGKALVGILAAKEYNGERWVGKLYEAGEVARAALAGLPQEETKQP